MSFWCTIQYLQDNLPFRNVASKPHVKNVSAHLVSSLPNLVQFYILYMLYHWFHPQMQPVVPGSVENSAKFVARGTSALPLSVHNQHEVSSRQPILFS